MISAPPARRRPVALRAAWLVLAALLVAFAGFEATTHGGWVWLTAAVGAALPFAGRLLHPVAARVLGHPVPPLLVLLAFTFLTETTTQAAPGFTLGLTWLGAVAVVRGFDLDRPRDRGTSRA